MNNVKVSKTLVMLVASGGRVGIGDAEPKSEHSLQVTGPGILVASDEGSSGGVVAFANDGGEQAERSTDLTGGCCRW